MADSLPSRLPIRWLVGDALLGLWCIAWALVGRVIYVALNHLTDAAASVQTASNELGHRAQQLGSNLPKAVRGPFSDLQGETGSLAGSAGTQATNAHHLAIVLGLAMAAVPIACALLAYLPPRRRFARDRRAALELSRSPGFLRLMAQRAVVNQPLAELARISLDPMTAIADGNSRAFALAETRRLGITLPPEHRQESRPPS